MEKLKTITEQIEIQEHSFYCDECGEYLGTSTELPDGWYKEYGDFELKFYVDGWYRVRKHLCETCRKNFISKVKVSLANMGFESN